MTLGKSTYSESVFDKLDHSPMATFTQLCFGAFALFGCGDNFLHAMMAHKIMEWALVFGLVLKQLPTNKTS